jgi:hypothetical protein
MKNKIIKFLTFAFLSTRLRIFVAIASMSTILFSSSVILVLSSSSIHQTVRMYKMGKNGGGNSLLDKLANLPSQIAFHLIIPQLTGTSLPTGTSSSGGTATTPTPATYAIHAAATPTPTPTSGTLATITVNPANPGAAISTSFDGVSTEPSGLCSLLLLDQQSSLISNEFKNLGSSILRVGGDSVEHVTWTPNGTYSCNFNNTVQTQALIDSMVTFINKINWKIIWGENLKNGDAATDANEAAYMNSAAGLNLVGIEIGNEPNLYGWTYNQYQSTWETFQAAIVGQGAIPIVDPGGTDCCSDFFTPFLNAESSKLVMATDHYYPLSAGNSPTLTQLLAANLMQQTKSSIQPRLQLANSLNIPYQMGETNAVADSPPENIGGAFGISLWALDYLGTLADLGVNGANVHGTTGDATSLFHTDGTPRPIYYGLLAFHYAAANGKAIPVQLSSLANVAVHSVLNNDSKLQVIIINKDQTQNVNAQINTTQTYTHASAIRLTASSVSATTGFTLGGNAVAADGTWSAGTPETVSLSGNTASVTVPIGSAAIVTFQ